MKKQLANIISSLRIAAGISLFFFTEVTPVFLAIYVICGITDVADGIIARKLQTQSDIGAILDTAGDVITYVAMAKILIAGGLVPVWVLVWFVISGVSILFSGIVAQRRFGKFNIVHSLFGKIMGFFAFALPFAYYFDILVYCYVAICVSATVSAVESSVIQLKLDEPDSTVSTIKQAIKKAAD